MGVCGDGPQTHRAIDQRQVCSGRPTSPGRAANRLSAVHPRLFAKRDRRNTDMATASGVHFLAVRDDPNDRTESS